MLDGPVGDELVVDLAASRSMEAVETQDRDKPDFCVTRPRQPWVSNEVIEPQVVVKCWTEK